jgi:hypothetical protein
MTGTVAERRFQGQVKMTSVGEEYTIKVDIAVCYGGATDQAETGIVAGIVYALLRAGSWQRLSR